MAQSSDNPNLVVVAAQAFMDAQGNCGDSHPWVFYSHDGGQDWKEEIMPGLTAGLAGGDPSVVYDSKDHVFVYSFIQFSRTDSTDSINVTSSFDGVSWSSPLILANHPGALDKPMITVDQSPSSPHFGRVLVAWRDDALGPNALVADFSDDGGHNWMGASDTITSNTHTCGNGVSPAFDASGEVMAAWFDCSKGDTIQEALSTDGGANWNQPSKVILSVNSIETNGPDSNCALNFGGSNFRCNSFPSLAGDPNPADAGGRAFFVVFANWEPTSQSGFTAFVSQLRGLSTVDGGGNWNGGNAIFDYLAAPDFGDKFFPWASFASDGRLNVGYSDREADASTTNFNGLRYNEGQTEASSLTALRSGLFSEFPADGTLGDPGSLAFIGDYAGIESQDNFDTFPVWTDVRNGNPDVRTTDLCYVDCPTFLRPNTPLFLTRAQGSAFDDFYQFSTDPSFGGAGAGVWNAVGIREGGDGSVIDDDLGLWNNRYFSSRVATGTFGPPTNDYVLENDNAGRGPSQPYFVDVHNLSSSGGPYAVEWANDIRSLGTSLTDLVRNGDVIRVYNMLDATGTTYHLGLRPAQGNTSNYRLSVHLNGNGTYQGSNAAAATSGNVAAGSPAFATVSTGASPAGADAVVVQNNNGGSGGYTLYRDTAAPAGTISVNGNVPATASPSVTLGLAAANPTAGDPVLDMRFSSDGVIYGPWLPFAASAPFSLPAGDGSKTVFAEFRNGAGAVSAAASDSIILDTTAPAITQAPKPSFGTGQLGTTAAPVQIKWAGTDAASGIGSYDLMESTDGGAFSLVVSPNVAHATVNLNPGHSYRFEVRAKDRAGNLSGFTVGSAFTLTAFQESASAIAYSGGWTQQSVSGAYGGSVRFATTAGRSATFSFTGSQVAWVSTVGANRGSATASADGGTAVTVSTHAASLSTRTVVYAKTLAAGTHSLVVKTLGTAGSPRVDVDVFLVIR